MNIQRAQFIVSRLLEADPDDVDFKRFSLKHGHKPCRLVSTWDGWKCACGRWSMVTSPFDMTGVEKRRAKQEWAGHRDRVQQVSEAVDPDEVDPRAMLRNLPGKHWIVSFDNVIGTEGTEGRPTLDYPIIAVTQIDAVDMATLALTQHGYNIREAYLVDAWVADKNDWDELKQVWADLLQQDTPASRLPVVVSQIGAVSWHNPRHVPTFPPVERLL